MSLLTKHVLGLQRTNQQHLLTTFQIILTGKNSLYDKSQFGIDKLDEMRRRALAAETPESIERLRSTIREQLSAREEFKIERVDDIERFLLLSQDKTDLDMALDVFQLYKTKWILKENLSFGEKFVKMCFLLDSPGKIHQLVEPNTKKIESSFLNRLTSFLIMNELVEKNEYERALIVFDSYVKRMEEIENVTQIKPKMARKKLTDEQLIPMGLFRLAIHSLLKMNTKESLEKMKRVIDVSVKFNSPITNTSIASCFLLAIKQGDYNYAYNLTFRISKWNHSLVYNLKIISLCHMERFEEAFFFVEGILAIRVGKNPKKILEGKFFPMTLKLYEQALAKHSSSGRSSGQHARIYEQMKTRVFDKDLEEYCTWTDQSSK